MQRLSCLTNIIPVIAKSDTLSAQEAIALKTTILTRLQTTSIQPFLFGKPLDDALLAVQSLSIIHPQLTTGEPEQYPFTTPTYPYAISSTPGPDNETMDASLLMSPDYVQPHSDQPSV
jgi:septin family protein